MEEYNLDSYFLEASETDIAEDVIYVPSYYRGKRDISRLNEAQRISQLEYISRYGRTQVETVGISDTTRDILRKPMINFGSIDYYRIDALPNVLFNIKGTEITYISSDYLSHSGKSMISRLFASKVLKFWCYTLGIEYKEGIELWATREPAIISGNIEIPYIIGEDVVSMIKDIIWLYRNKNPRKIRNYIPSSRVSPQLYNVVRARQLSQKRTFRDILLEIKNRLWYDYSRYGFVWDIPKVSMDYLLELLDRLTSGSYFLGIPIPIYTIEGRGNYLRFKFPIKCTDTHLVTSDYRFEKGKDDYDLTQYVFERD